MCEREAKKKRRKRNDETRGEEEMMRLSDMHMDGVYEDVLVCT